MDLFWSSYAVAAILSLVLSAVYFRRLWSATAAVNILFFAFTPFFNIATACGLAYVVYEETARRRRRKQRERAAH